MYPAKLSDVDQSVRARVSIERRIVKRTVADLLAAGFELAVYDGEVLHKRTTDAAKLHKDLLETDEDYLFVYKAGEKERFGYVYFVYGNDGYDVISDYTVNLEDALKGVNEFANTLDN
jgi:hypothetical protein